MPSQLEYTRKTGQTDGLRYMGLILYRLPTDAASITGHQQSPGAQASHERQVSDNASIPVFVVSEFLADRTISRAFVPTMCSQSVCL